MLLLTLPRVLLLALPFALRLALRRSVCELLTWLRTLWNTLWRCTKGRWSSDVVSSITWLVGTALPDHPTLFRLVKGTFDETSFPSCPSFPSFPSCRSCRSFHPSRPTSPSTSSSSPWPLSSRSMDMERRRDNMTLAAMSLWRSSSSSTLFGSFVPAPCIIITSSSSVSSSVFPSVFSSVSSSPLTKQPINTSVSSSLLPLSTAMRMRQEMITIRSAQDRTFIEGWDNNRRQRSSTASNRRRRASV